MCNLNDFLRATCFFCLAGLAGKFTIENPTLIFLWYIMVTCDEKIKVLSRQNVLLWIFLEIRYLIWRYAESNRLFVGSGYIPLNIELKQDDYTVCCIHSVVGSLVAPTLPSKLEHNQRCLAEFFVTKKCPLTVIFLWEWNRLSNFLWITLWADSV